MRRPALVTAIVAGAIVASAACSADDPSPEALIDDVRVLAVQAEPPVIGLDETARLTTLVVGPGGRRDDIELSFRACYPWQPMVSPDRDCGPDASIALSSEEFSVGNVLAAFPPPDEVLEQFGALPRSVEGRCAAAYPSWDFPIVVSGEVGGQRLLISKRVRVALGTLATPRQNPRIDALVFDGSATTSPIFEPGRAHELTVAIDRDTVDEVCAEDADAELALETLEVTFYSTAGTFLGSSIEAELGLDGDEAIGTTTWSSEETSPLSMWLVVTDSEGGISWTQHLLAPAL